MRGKTKIEGEERVSEDQWREKNKISLVSFKMGARTTKQQGNSDGGNNDLVTRFTISDEGGPQLSIDQVSTKGNFL